MKELSGPPGKFQELRNRAEQILSQREAKDRDLAGADLMDLIRELEVHQLELELQSEELRNSHKELEESRKEYAELYEHAPAGYVTLDSAGLITRLNAAAKDMLGLRKSTGGGFSVFIDPDNHRTYYELIQEAAREKGRKVTGELRILKAMTYPFHAHMEVSSSWGEESQFHGWSIIFMDISVRKRAEEALRENERKSNKFLADLIRLGSQPVGVGYPDGRIGLVNSALEQLTGYSMEELQSIHWAMDLTPPDWLPMERARLEELHRTGEPVRYEKEYIRKNGAHVPVEILVHLVTDPDGKPAYYSYLTDLTERKRAEDALRQSERRFKAIYEQAPLGIALIDSLSGKFLEVNSRYCRIAGRRREEMLRTNFQAITHPDDLRQNLDHMAMLIAGKIHRFKWQKRYIRPDGSIVWVNLTVEPVWEEGQVQKRHLAIVEDITAQRQIEDALRCSEEKYRRLVESAHTLIFEVTPEGTITFCNQFSLDFFGYAREELIGAHVFGTILPQVESSGRDLSALLKQIALHPEEYRYYENENTLKNGERVWVAWTNRAFFDEKGELSGILAIGVDITARRELEDYLRIERDVAIQLGSAATISQALESVLDACLLIKGIDSGAVYLADARTNELKLASYK